MSTSIVLLLGVLAAGGFNLPLGLPPLPEDPLIAKVAPDECIAYISWAGMAKPDPASKNHTEQLLAERQVQQLFEKLDKAITAGVVASASDREEEKVLAAEVPKLFKATLTKPAAFYVKKMSFGATGVAVDAGAIVHTGDDTADLMRSVLNLEALAGEFVSEVEIDGRKWKQFPTPGGTVMWSFRGRYLIVGVGKDAVSGIMKRAKTDEPKWLVAIKKRLAVKRISSIVYVDVKKLVGMAAAFEPVVGAGQAAIISGLGLKNVSSIASVSGLDETKFLTRTFVALDGEPTGLLAAVIGEPLTEADLAVIPADATFAMAARIDLEKGFRGFLKGLSDVNPRFRDEVEREMKQGEDELGLSFSDDIFKALGTRWRIYNSPAEGGLVATGLTAIVDVRDGDRLAKALVKIEAMAQREAARRDGAGPPGRRRRRHVTVKHIEFAKQKVYFMNFVGAEFPFAPSWCLRDKEFIVGLFPSHVKSVLLRGKDFKSLSTVKEVSDLVKGDGTYTAIGYQDTREIFKLAYPALQMFAQFLCSEAQRNRIDIDISALPSAATIAKHLGVDVTTVAKKDDGIEITSRQSAPMGVASPALIGAVLTMLNLRPDSYHEHEHDHDHGEGSVEAAPAREFRRERIERVPFR